MYGEIGDNGFLKIGNADDRVTVATILCKNGYTTQIVRRKRSKSSYDYFVKYDMQSNEIINPEVEKNG